MMKGIQDLIPRAGKLTQGASAAQTDLCTLLANLETEITAIQDQLNRRRMSTNAKIKLENQLSALEQSRDLVQRELNGFDAAPWPQLPFAARAPKAASKDLLTAVRVPRNCID